MGDGKGTLFQQEHLLDCIETFREDFTTPMISQPQKESFKVNSDDEVIEENRSAIFHSVV